MTTPKRWQVTAASALCMAAGMSALFMGSFPVFLEPVSKDLGWGRSVFPQFITILSLSSALLMPIGGRIIDRIGVRWPVTIGLLMIAAGFGMVSLLKDAGLLFWGAALLMGAGAAISGPPAFVPLIASWYDRNRALALGCIVSVAPACSQAIVSPMTQQLLAILGWRAAYRSLGMIVLAAAVIAALGFLRPRSHMPGGPEIMGTSSGVGAAMRTPTFWLLAIGASLGSATVIGLTVHLVAWQTGRGVAPETAALVLSVLFITGTAGAFLAGYAADRIRDSRLLQLFYALPIVGIAIMTASVALPALMLGSIFIGIAMGATTGLAPFFATRYFGLKASAQIFGIILSLTMVAIGLAPLLIGLGYDVSGSYIVPMAVAAVVLAIATGCIGLLDYSAGFRRSERPAADIYN
ncbi:MFS transporter [Novosphingobium sp. Leaf2]|uniref:MFS transporter n=1 Tax=Novosphingobium sp. Leaf2 TaxID=1735670 RepID=UPI0006F8DED4|nr:MFS transporter [Novosphingobium sp. Leaf2]KQM20809.1 MFS transporter [Novosphingobium sp. Leaf2]